MFESYDELVESFISLDNAKTFCLEKQHPYKYKVHLIDGHYCVYMTKTWIDLFTIEPIIIIKNVRQNVKLPDTCTPKSFWSSPSTDIFDFCVPSYAYFEDGNHSFPGDIYFRYGGDNISCDVSETVKYFLSKEAKIFFDWIYIQEQGIENYDTISSAILKFSYFAY